MSSTALLSTVQHPMPPHLSVAPLQPDIPYAPTLEPVHPPKTKMTHPTAHPPPPTTPPPTTTAPPKRPRPFRPPPLVIPDPPTSLPTSFYSQGSPRPPPPPSTPSESFPCNNRSAAASRKGLRRRQNEDRVFARVDNQVCVYGVCDGHGGTQVAETVAEMFPRLMANGCCLTEAFSRVEEVVCGMLSTLFRRPSLVGTTLTAVEISHGKYLKVAHVGDSRAVLIDRMGVATTLTRDHSPNRPDETRRIEKAGGGVLQGRVNGVLAVSRAIGDTALKSVVSAEPELLDYTLSPGDQLVVLGTDGLWDLVSDAEVAAFLRSRPRAPHSVAVPLDLCDSATGLVELAVSRGSKDDTSVVLIDIRNSL